MPGVCDLKKRPDLLQETVADTGSNSTPHCHFRACPFHPRSARDESGSDILALWMHLQVTLSGHRRDRSDRGGSDPSTVAFGSNQPMGPHGSPVVSRFKARDPLDRIFEIGIILKGLDGILETIGGLLLLAVTPATINTVVSRLTQHELSEDANDFIANHLLRYAHGLTGSAVTFAALYLLVHGIVKIVLVAALLRNQIWAYPWMIAFLLIFIFYQLYRLVLSLSIGLSALTIFDAAIVWLTWREWRKQTAGRAIRLPD